jgi:hypothetical protein
MKLVVLSVGTVPPGTLSRWARDPDCITVATCPVPEGCEDWMRAPIGMTSKVSLSERHTRLFEPWFDSTSEQSDFRLAGAKVGLVEAANCQLFFQVWNCLGLLLDLDQIVQMGRVDRIEFVTDGTQHGRWPIVVEAFAESRRLPWRSITIAKAGETRALRSLGRLRNWMAQSPAAMPALVRLVRDHVVRADRDARGRAENSPRSSGRLGIAEGRLKGFHAAMLVYVPKSWRYLLPIRSALLDSGNRVSMLSPRAATDFSLRELGCPYTSLRLRWDGLRCHKAIEECLTGFPLNPPDEELARLASAGGPLRRLLWQLGRQMYEDYANVAVRLPALFCDRGVDVAVGTDCGSVAGRAFFRTAEHLGIASVFVQHGALQGGMGTSEYFTKAKRLVWGESSRDVLLRAGLRAPEDTVVMGSPCHEQLLTTRAAAVGRDDRSGKCDPADMVLITFGVPGNFIAEASFAKAANEVFAAAAQLPGVRFVIRPHPSDRAAVWQELISEYGLSNIRFVPDADTYALICECRMLVTMGSTTGAEAIFLGKPVAAVNLERQELGMDYIGAGAAYLASGPGELTVLIKSVLASPEGTDPLAHARRAFAEQFLHVESRPAADRIAEYLKELVSPSHATVARTVES